MAERGQTLLAVALILPVAAALCVDAPPATVASFAAESGLQLQNCELVAGAGLCSSGGDGGGLSDLCPQSCGRCEQPRRLQAAESLRLQARTTRYFTRLYANGRGGECGRYGYCFGWGSGRGCLEYQVYWIAAGGLSTCKENCERTPGCVAIEFHPTAQRQNGVLRYRSAVAAFPLPHACSPGSHPNPDCDVLVRGAQTTNRAYRLELRPRGSVLHCEPECPTAAAPAAGTASTSAAVTVTAATNTATPSEAAAASLCATPTAKLACTPIAIVLACNERPMR